MKKFLIPTIAIFIIVACEATKKLPSAVGVVQLRNYALNEKVHTPDEVNFKVFTNADDFNSSFHMTKSTPATVVVPDFNSQTVVAVILQPTTKIKTLEISKAEIAGTNYNIYYSVIDTSKRTSYEHTPAVAVTVPKALDVKQVNFYNNTTKEKSVPVTY